MGINFRRAYLARKNFWTYSFGSFIWQSKDVLLKIV